MARNPIVLVHGYSDEGASFRVWERILEQRGYDVAMIHACSYRSLTNEVTIKDIAEGFDRALRIRTGLSEDEPFDVIVHSTGMLVIRAWLTAYAGRRDRLKHLIGLAPATFGSPLAHKGRSWLGALFKGNKHLGPDFLEAGDRILDELELASRFTWDLAHLDLLGNETFYGPTRRTPYVFVFCGNETYGGLRQLFDEPGSDGSVRWASCPLNTRKIILDFTIDPERQGSEKRVSVADWKNTDIPLIPIDGKNHGTILSDPGNDLADLVDSALQVSSAASFTQWIDDATRKSQRARAKMDEWQQFVVRLIDERGDPVPDYNIQLFKRSTGAGADNSIHQFSLDVHTYKGDPSLRCFHVRLADLDYKKLPNLWIRVMASSGSQLVGYEGFGSEKQADTTLPPFAREARWDGTLDISSLSDDTGIKFFYPFTTTLIELRLNREPLPLTVRMKSAGSSSFGRKAVTHLKKVDPVLAQVIDRIGVYKGWPTSNGSHFDAVCRSIVFQQLSGKAAGTIHGRFQGLYGGRPPLPDELATTSDEQLRAVGLSRQKSAYLKDLGGKVASGELPIETLHELTDEEVITALTQVKGIGRWTAQMFLMFRLGRPDVLPDLDLGVQKGIQRAYRLRKLPTPEKVKKIGAKWAPYRTVGSWYMWRLMDAPTPVPRSGGGGGRGGGGGGTG